MRFIQSSIEIYVKDDEKDDDDDDCKVDKEEEEEEGDETRCNYNNNEGAVADIAVGVQ